MIPKEIKQIRDAFEKHINSSKATRDGLRAPITEFIKRVDAEADISEVMSALMDVTTQCEPEDKQFLDTVYDVLSQTVSTSYPGSLSGEQAGAATHKENRTLEKDPISLFRELRHIISEIILLSDPISRGVISHALHGTLEAEDAKRKKIEAIKNEHMRAATLGLEEMMSSIGREIERGWQTIDDQIEKITKEMSQ